MPAIFHLNKSIICVPCAGVWGGVAVGLALLASLVLQQLGKRRGSKGV